MQSVHTQSGERRKLWAGDETSSAAPRGKNNMHVAPRPADENACGWFDILPRETPGQTLRDDQVADWVIIGGGFTGLAAARQLAEHMPEARILLLDAQRIGMGASGQNAGFVIDIPQFLGSNDRSTDADFLKTRNFNLAAIGHLRKLVQAHGIECQWSEKGKFHCAAEGINARSLVTFRDRLERLDVPFAWLESNDLEQRLGIGFYHTGIRTTDCVLIQPAALARALAGTLPENIEIHEESPVTEIHYGNKVTVKCAQGSITADNVILATNAFTQSFGFLKSHIVPVYLTGSLTRPLTDKEHATLGDVEDWGIVSAHRMGATVRYTKDWRIFIRNTVEFRPKPVPGAGGLDRYRNIHMVALRRRFPMLPDLAFDHTWGGFVGMTRNKTTVFGQLADNMYASVCYNASGAGKATIFGKLLADRIVGASSQQLSAAESLAPARRLPPRPFLDIGAHASMARLRRNLGRDL